VHALLLQVPADGGAPQGMAAIVKAPGNRWLGDAATRRDYYFDLGALPESAPLLSEAAADAAELPEAAAGDGGAAAGAGAGAAAVEAGAALHEVLGWDPSGAALQPLALARAPPPRGGGGAGAAAAAAAQKQRRAAAQKAGAPTQPELPPPWVEGPPRDATQKATLGAAHLAAAARARLAAWAAGQEGLAPAGVPRVRHGTGKVGAPLFALPPPPQDGLVKLW
jgi:hypothetical protein